MTPGFPEIIASKSGAQTNAGILAFPFGRINEKALHIPAEQVRGRSGDPALKESDIDRRTRV